MFDVGFWEIALIFMLGLMVLGPEKLPRIAAQIGRWVGRARRTASQLRYQLEREINLDDRPRGPYTPPPKTSQIIPPPGKQSSQAGASDDSGDASPPAEAPPAEAPADSQPSSAADSESDRGTST